MIFSPSSAVWLAVVAGCAQPILLITVSRWSPGRYRLGQRFWISSLASALIWAVAVWTAGDRDPWSILAGAEIMVAAIFVVYLVWGQLAFGFMVDLIARLGEKGYLIIRPEELDAFCRDRTELLRRAGMIVGSGPNMVITARGRQLARVASLLIHVFSVKRE